MNTKEIWWVTFNPSVGAEINKNDLQLLLMTIPLVFYRFGLLFRLQIGMRDILLRNGW